jgi:CBS domain-containing protein
MTEAERVERFEAAYNRIDRALNELIRGGKDHGRHKQGFTAKVRTLANQQRRYARYADFLLEIAELRNAIVHNRFGDEMYIAVPNEATVTELEHIEQRMLAPDRVIPQFQKVVMTLDPGDTLAETWKRIAEHGYSRFPIYAPEGFVGLLTFGGIARWCAKHVRQGRLEIDATSVHVEDVLAEDRRRERVAFVDRDALVDDVDDLFTQQFASGKPLEAALVTEHGKPHERPIGIICASDVAALKD